MQSVSRFRSRRVPLALVFASFAVACQGTGERRSDWPPADFYLEVRGRRQTDDRLIERQSWHVFADGFSVYREVDPEDAFADDWPPVFSRVSAYRMLPQSVRSLTRALQAAGLFQSETVVGIEVDAEDVVAIAWRAFGEERRIVARGRVYGSVVEALHVVNAYLPAGCAFTLPDMTGEPEPPRLSGIPPPARSAEGAYRLHAEWAANWPDLDLQWRTEFFALALRSGQLERAAALLAEMEREQARHVEVFPDDRGPTKVAIERLRHLLELAGRRDPVR